MYILNKNSGHTCVQTHIQSHVLVFSIPCNSNQEQFLLVNKPECKPHFKNIFSSIDNSTKFLQHPHQKTKQYQKCDVTFPST